MMGMNPKKMQKMMQKMGIKSSDITAEYVIIKTATEELIFDSPQVSKVNMMGQETYQIVGSPTVRPVEEEKDITISAEDVEAVRSQTGATIDEAKEALKRSEGDLARAIIDIKESQ